MSTKTTAAANFHLLQAPLGEISERQEYPLIEEEADDEQIKESEENLSAYVKQEDADQPVYIKEEEEDINKFFITDGEDEGPSEAGGGSAPPDGSDDSMEGSQENGLIAPLSDSDEDFEGHTTGTPGSIMEWPKLQRAFAVEAFFSSGRSIVATQRAFRRHFNIAPRGRVPGRQSIVSWVNNFRETGDVKKKKPGLPRTARTPQNIDAVRQSVLRSPQRSARKHASALGLSARSVRRILHEDLKFHPYKLAMVQELNPRDFIARENACEVLLGLPDDTLIFFSGEAHFHLSGSVNKPNMRYWCPENPRELHQRPLHALHVTVWCALSRVGIIGPWFFEENEEVVSVTPDRYVNMINECFLPTLNSMGVENVWFQQDCAMAHTARASMIVLRQNFPGHLISLRGDLHWPARSPDLSPCDYFLWGYLKSIVYNDRPSTLSHLKNNIRRAVANIPIDMLERVDQDFRVRLTQCIEKNGRHLTDIIFKTDYSKMKPQERCYTVEEELELITNIDEHESGDEDCDEDEYEDDEPCVILDDCPDSDDDQPEEDTEYVPTSLNEDQFRSSSLPSEEHAKDGTVWRHVPHNGTKRGRVHAGNLMHSSEGPTAQAKKAITSPLTAFLCLLDPTILQKILEYTEAEALRSSSSPMNFTMDELKAFIGLLFMRGITGGNSMVLDDYWTEDFGYTIFRKTMSRERFRALMRYLRFDDRTTRKARQEEDKFALISEIFGQFVKNCTNFYIPGANITVDKQLFLTKARCPFTQHIATKSNKFGIKFWVAVDVDSHYMINMFPYLGKDESPPAGHRLPDNVVLQLMEPFLDKGRNVTTDNFFTSMQLAKSLLQRKTTIVGTMKKTRREIPPSAKQQWASTRVMHSNNATLTVYQTKAKKNMCVLSTMHREVEFDEVTKKPSTINHFNITKCGVDIMDRLCVGCTQ
ncbi:uncharacterized protein LOC130905701 isoform X2 [Corythoichthys intestinalis]|uniref:uncharacterized protein LOC130905701 isoform X2 n=1 Tax=Corythoichthys intestinalis TaxID=161448 RepID=UPI0025A5D60B|nr:uncharacterized protein LOC130905701 isoform X2 [Corythoichthys intestinalis]